MVVLYFNFKKDDMDNFKRYICLSMCLLFLNFTNSIYAQSSISGTIMTLESEYVSYANVLLLNAEDSTLIKGDLSDEAGNFNLSVAYNLPVIISVSYLGYDDYTSSMITLKDGEKKTISNIILKEGIALDEVQIVAKKPLFEQKIDRLVVNVASSATSSGGTALEVLERSPGVIINRQSGALSMIGKEGVVLMINGKITYQPTESIVQMLEGMSADNIERIELITTPPANFDAEGNAGFINIVLKQRTDLGFNGNTSLSIGYGEGEVGSANINLNYRNNNVNIYGNYSHSRQAKKQLADNYRSVFFEGKNTISELTSDRDPLQSNHSISLGLDYEVSKNTVMGFLVSAYDNKWSMDAINYGTTKIDDLLVSQLSVINDEVNQWKNFFTNINLEHKLDERQKINMNIDYVLYEAKNPVNYSTDLLDQDGTLINNVMTRSNKYTPLNIAAGQLDYENNINNKVKFIAGIKAAFSEFENDVSTEEFKVHDWEFLEQFTNSSDLKENRFAGYASVDYKMDAKNMFKIGLRYEYTDSKLNTKKEGTVVDRQFGKLFPSLFYSRTINENQSLNLSYNKRITRPTFNDMAPFALFLDPNTFFFGNAGLQPAITDNIKVDYTYKSYLLSIQYSVEDSTIVRFQDNINLENNQQAFGPVNLSQTQILSGSLTIPVYIGNKWTMQNSFSAIWSENSSFYNSESVQFSQFSYVLNSTQSYILGSGYSTELTGFYRSSALSGRSEIDPMYGITFGLQKKFDSGSSLRFNIRDVLDSVEFHGGTNLSDQGFLTEYNWDVSNRTFSITYTTSFGNKKLKASRNRTTGSEEERNRVQ